MLTVKCMAVTIYGMVGIPTQMQAIPMSDHAFSLIQQWSQAARAGSESFVLLSGHGDCAQTSFHYDGDCRWCGV